MKFADAEKYRSPHPLGFEHKLGDLWRKVVEEFPFPDKILVGP